MKYALFLLLYNLLYPVFLLVSLPGFFIKMKRRGGLLRDVWERLGFYRTPREQEAAGGIYVHAVSVGEVFIALKWIRCWQATHAEPIVLATSTATGLQMVRRAALPGVRALYSPVDLPCVVRGCLRRFEPKVVVLIEAELWPNQARLCRRHGIPMVMLNARLSPRSERRYAKVRSITGGLFSHLSALGAQNERDAGRFAGIGVPPGIITITGSIKFDVLGDTPTGRREDFSAILRQLSGGRPVILASSTHAGEEVLIARAARAVGGFPLIVPRHMERRAEVARALQEAGFEPILRTSTAPLPAAPTAATCYIADTTGELREWTALADVTIIGKSFLATGGQNPVEAIAAHVPVIVGPDMSNFADLTALLCEQQAIYPSTADTLESTLRTILSTPQETAARTKRAYAALSIHSGATQRSVQLVERFL
ncbi:MAG: hypothetical protein J1E42_04415 [Akkermansiaceae bacterium]|nr:hypothetical protein [Akkermansiaceae bacterium]